jgi:imidazolonepropionase-like amidohydrolase
MIQALTGGLLIDGTGRDPIENASVIINEHGHIQDAGQIDSFPKGVVVTDVGGRTIMPGLMKERGTFLVPTLQAPHGGIRRGEESPGSVLPQSIRKAREVIDDHCCSNMAVEAGVKVAMGTDAGVDHHGNNAEEIRLLVVNGNPLDDVTILEDKSKLLVILQGGRTHKDTLSAA